MKRLKQWLAFVWLWLRAMRAGYGCALACLPEMDKPWTHPSRYFTADEMTRLRRIRSLGNFWAGYDAPKPFDTPDDEQPLLRIYSSDNITEIALSKANSTPDLIYVYVFADVTPGGEPFGSHPCAAVKTAARGIVVGVWLGLAFVLACVAEGG